MGRDGESWGLFSTGSQNWPGPSNPTATAAAPTLGAWKLGTVALGRLHLLWEEFAGTC